MIIILSGLILTGCNSDEIIIKQLEQRTINNTYYDSSRSFELQSFADSCSFVIGINITSFNCSSGDVSFLKYNNNTSNWTLSCCNFKSSKCYWYNTSDPIIFNESKQFADNILGNKFESNWGSMCCNSQMSQCFWQKPSVNGSFESCGMEYDQILVSSSYNNTTGNWSLTTCVDGFK